MNDFTASNGIAIRTKDGDLDFKRPEPYGWLGLCGGDVVDALREFFQAEADERLGRWRWPENPDYVVYPKDGDLFEVLHEPTGLVLTSTVSGNAPFKDEHAQAARAYFDAHPEPKPWHDAQPGEVFLVTWPGSEREEAVVVPGAWPKAWECVTSARRIWPEVAS